MASIHVTQSGSGDLSGSNVLNTIPIGSLTATEWNSPAKSEDGTERMYFYGNITSLVNPLGAGGTSPTEKLWVDTSNADIIVDNSTAISTGQKSYLTFLLGDMSSHPSNNELILCFNSENDIDFIGGTLNNTHAPQVFRALCSNADANNIVIDGMSVQHQGSVDAIKFTLSGTAGHLGKYVNCAVKNCKINGGKIVTIYSNPEQQLITDGRMPIGFDIDNNTIRNAPGPAIQMVGLDATTVKSYIRRNKVYDSGSLDNNTNAIQINYCLGDLIVEENYIDTVVCDGNGDGCAIMVDHYTEVGYRVSRGTKVYRNYARGCQHSVNSAGIALWACADVLCVGNICEDNNVGITASDPMGVPTWTATTFVTGTTTTVNVSDIQGRVFEPGDQITLSGVTITTGPDINGVHTAISGTSTSVVIDFDSTGGAYFGGSLDAQRCFGNKANGNTLKNNKLAGLQSKHGTPGPDYKSNILSGNFIGYQHQISHDAQLATEQYNIFYNNGTDFVNNLVPSSIDPTSRVTTIDPLDENFELSALSDVIGLGYYWEPEAGLHESIGYNGEPFPRIAKDPGANQSRRLHPLHPAYKG